MIALAIRRLIFDLKNRAAFKVGQASQPDESVVSPPDKSDDLESLGARVVQEFRDFDYKIPAVGDVEKLSSEKLVSKKEELISLSPFKSEIFLPTSRVELPKQVSGLSRVVALSGKENFRISKNRFRALKRLVSNTGKKRVFIIGNGPSLKVTDLGLLENEITIGFNGIFLLKDFMPTIYIVEDHLVGEDRSKEIKEFDCPVKIFPTYLSYCVPCQKNSIFLNHVPRTSYPFDTDFSSDVAEVSYTGGTVTYTGLQVAISLGFKEIYLVGVDASYKVQNVKRENTYGTGVLESTSDDVNHFDPSYFGKGFRWHDPNVQTMLQAYRKARNYANEHGVILKNAALGGELETFPRVDYYQLFPAEIAYPRVAIMDFTHANFLCATGIVKKKLLEGWSKNAQFHLHGMHPANINAFQRVEYDCYPKGAEATGIWAAFRSLIEYDPDVIYVRPTHDRPVLCMLQIAAILVLKKPFVIHYMDDWLAKLSVTRGDDYCLPFTQMMQYLFDCADAVFAISGKMSIMLQDRFDVPEEKISVIHNYISSSENQQSSRHSQESMKLVRYFGAIEPDMALNSVILLAQAVEELSASIPDGIRFEIYTSEYYIENYSSSFSQLKSTRLLRPVESYASYLDLLADSDVNALCYNFDEMSETYLRFSLANKLPEIVGANAPFIAIGSDEIGTIGLLDEEQYPGVVKERDLEKVKTALSELLQRADGFDEAYEKSIDKMRLEFSDSENRVKFQTKLRNVAKNRVSDLNEKTRKNFLKLCADFASISGRNRDIVEDLKFLQRFAECGSSTIARTLDLVKSHGVRWKLRDKIPEIDAMVKRSVKNNEIDKDSEAELFAFLLVSLCDGRFKNHVQKILPLL